MFFNGIWGKAQRSQQLRLVGIPDPFRRKFCCVCRECTLLLLQAPHLQRLMTIMCWLPGMIPVGHVSRLSINAAVLVCKQLGLGSSAVVSAQSTLFPPVEKTSVVWMDSDRCNGSESDVLSCLNEASRGESSSPLYQVACLDATGAQCMAHRMLDVEGIKKLCAPSVQQHA